MLSLGTSSADRRTATVTAACVGRDQPSNQPEWARQEPSAATIVAVDQKRKLQVACVTALAGVGSQEETRPEQRRAAAGIARTGGASVSLPRRDRSRLPAVFTRDENREKRKEELVTR
ncbi:hypothetical protein JCGZ_10894 [Jatropha curcas]|uniref:Uncharacterized protein n=1 Tax=Jatropha curcas TaxID=180498 RepID=A0A067KSA5_JATCU|nr:hypothetical protein JCGZ_10894 [Jatropha curcas]